MIAFPNAKINIGLFITEKRTDGFHNLISCFYPVDWTDILEVVENDNLKFSSSGIEIPGSNEDNLCIKAWKALNSKFGIPPVHIHLHKNIPIGAGLGGGSSDAAYTIKLLNEKFNLQLSDEEMESLVKPLGSDCAFFIKNKPVIAIQKGDVFLDCPVSLNSRWIVLVYPNVHISTKEAYAGIIPSTLKIDLNVSFKKPISSWRQEISNDFERHLFLKFPVLSYIKDEFYNSGAIYASMSGSGSCIYGIYDHEPDDTRFRKDGYQVKKMQLK